MKVRVCTPCLTGSTSVAFTRSMIETAVALTLAGISFQWSALSFANFIQCARNELAGEFLDSDCTDLVFIDDDMGWETGGFLQMLMRDVDVIGAICPRRKYPREWNARVIGKEGELLECSYIGTALLRIRRNVLESMPRAFDAGYEGPRFMGEDAWFCREYRKSGGRIWAEPNITITHSGPHEWRGNYSEEAATR